MLNHRDTRNPSMYASGPSLVTPTVSTLMNNADSLSGSAASGFQSPYKHPTNYYSTVDQRMPPGHMPAVAPTDTSLTNSLPPTDRQNSGVLHDGGRTSAGQPFQNTSFSQSQRTSTSQFSPQFTDAVGPSQSGHVRSLVPHSLAPHAQTTTYVSTGPANPCTAHYIKQSSHTFSQAPSPPFSRSTAIPPTLYSSSVDHFNGKANSHPNVIGAYPDISAQLHPIPPQPVFNGPSITNHRLPSELHSVPNHCPSIPATIDHPSLPTNLRNAPVSPTSTHNTSTYPRGTSPQGAGPRVAPIYNQFTPKSSPHPPSVYSRQPNVDSALSFRSPGTPATLSEWNQLKSPIGLLRDYYLLPSDTIDRPPQSGVSTVNCDQSIMRCTLNNFPATSKLLSRCRLPLGLVMHPFRDLSNLHTINSTVIVRCRYCRTYINPFVQFIDSGRRWRCPVCFLSNSVPDDFFYDPTSHSYGDPSRRPEIRSATVEFIAPSEYMLRPPQPATYLFCFDVSHNAISTGYLRVACDLLMTSLNRIPGGVRRQISFITFDSAMHFYKLAGDSMKMMVCPDLDEPFLPDPEGLINLIAESTDAIQDFLRNLPDCFANTHDTGNCLGSTLQVALKLIGNTGGRITVFNTCLPNAGVGQLQIREEISDRNSADVKVLGPAIDFYKTFALDCAAHQVAIDLFVMNSQYCDVATLSGAARFSSGCVYHYPNFYSPSKIGDTTSVPSETLRAAETAHHQGIDEFQQPPSTPSLIELERFSRDFDRYLTRKIGFEAVMRIRCTHGLSIQSFHGSFFVRSTDLMSLPNVNPDAGFAVQLGLSESVENYSSVCCQAAILYTSAKGDRRIRVHTLCLPVVHNPVEVFHGADQAAIACLIGKMAVDRAISSGLSFARDAIANSVADALSAFATAMGMTPSSSISSYSMACPPNLRLLPLYICGLLRYSAFRVGSPVPADCRSASLERLKTAPLDDMLAVIYPHLYAVHQFVSSPITSDSVTLAQKAATLCLSDYGDSHIEADQCSDDERSTSSENSDVMYDPEQLPGQLHLSARSIARDGVYLLDTGELMILLVGCCEEASTTSSSQSEMLQQLLGISSPSELPIEGGPFALPVPRSSEQTSSDDKTTSAPIAKRRLMALINLLRLRHPLNTALVCMRHDAPAPLRTRFLSALVEDRTEFAPSYQEFLQMIQNLMKG